MHQSRSHAHVAPGVSFLAPEESSDEEERLQAVAAARGKLTGGCLTKGNITTDER